MNAKTNTTHALFPAHATALSFLTERFSLEWKNTRATLKIFGAIVSKSFIPENIRELHDVYKQKLKAAGLHDTDWAKQHLRALDRQAKMGVDKAREQYLPFHDTILGEVTSLSKQDADATTSFRTIFGLIDETIVPATPLKALVPLMRYKAEDLGIIDKAWVKGPLVGLETRLQTLMPATNTMNGAAVTESGVQPAQMMQGESGNPTS